MEATIQSETRVSTNAGKRTSWKVNKTDPLDAKISAYNSVLNKEPSDTVTLRELLDRVQGGRWRESIEAIREAHENGGKEQSGPLKKLLPAVTLSGRVTEGGRAKALHEGRFDHSGCVQADIDGDGLGGRDPAEVRDSLKGDEFLSGAFLSPTGAGVKALVRVPRCKTEEEHKRAWQAVAAHFENVHGLKIDKSTKDSPRLCYVSYDPEAWIRDTPAVVLPFLPESAEEIPKAKKPKSKTKTAPPISEPRKRALNERQWTVDEVANMLNAIPTRPDYPEWLKIISAVGNEIGEAGIPLLMAWSPEEVTGEYAEKLSVGLATVGIGSLIRLATSHGWQRQPDNSTRGRLDFSGGEDASLGFPITHADDIGGIAEPLDFVQDLLTEGGASVVYGPSNCGKSFWILDLAVSVATGEPFRGELETDQGAVVYVALEGASGVRNRIEALRKSGRLPKDALLFLCFSPVSLMDSGHAQQLAESVKQAAEKSGGACRLVILDTLARAMAGGDENSGKDMTEAVKQIDAIRGATGAHVCVVHHCGKDEARGARGHSSLRAAVDTEIEITRPDGPLVSVVTVKKQRDLIARGVMAFHLQPVELGKGRRGKPITSCVVVHESDFAEPIKKVGRTPKATDSAFLALLPQPSTTAWKEAAMEKLNVGDTAFYRVLKGIKSRGTATLTKNNGWERKFELRK